MKVRLTVSVDEHARYVVAKYFAPASHGRDSVRRRATRAQMKRFVLAALRTAIKQQADELPARSRSAARRLAEGVVKPYAETLRPPSEEQRSLRW